MIGDRVEPKRFSIYLPITHHSSLITALNLPAFAKINWNLRVLGRRANGFHEICTIFQTISLCDDLTFELADEISLTCDQADIPIDENNLIVRAANRLRERFSVSQGARIHLEKRIPSPGGLGGGSSDAAVALVALVKLWRIEISAIELNEIAAALGADVPFFLIGGTALGTGLGTQIEPLADVPKTLLLVVTPEENVSTADAYKSLDAPGLTEKSLSGILAICRFETGDRKFLETELHNDFENTVFSGKPEIARVKQTLLRLNARNALMSGSGASVYGVFDDPAVRAQTARRLRETEKSWKVFECETISAIEYQKKMFRGLQVSDDLL